ncbi:taste receptor type 1 member 1-like [Archocentrus centrarchus]|uniref:taste receptor type 1 member 1-like n=1 Tax=Archocentrus centrarchus TaxID=63155 RepID=UPI0011EA1895|nr:taste receptor type 1 member 1-like [Archocentrus centrarchus]
MKYTVAYLCVLWSFLRAFDQCAVPASEFQLQGDYLIGGLFDIHHVDGSFYHHRPEVIDCSSAPFILSSYRRFQLMRFSVEEINNSTKLLPNVFLGYEMFDHCTDAASFPGPFNLISTNGLIRPLEEPHGNLSKVIAVVGTYTSQKARTVAPLFMMDLIPMVSYGAASSIFSRKQSFPSFMRTVHPNKDVVEVILSILREFNWKWVAFLYVNDDYGTDGLDLFMKKTKGTGICLAYNKGLDHDTDYKATLNQINAQNINVIIVFAPEWTVEELMKSVKEQHVTNKVWIAGDAWSLNKNIQDQTKGIKALGTVLGVAEPKITIPGFSEFIHSLKAQSHCENAEQEFCNQLCNCSGLSAEEIIDADPSFSIPVYSAVYSIAHALHNVLQCGAGRCKDNITVYPYMVLTELRKSNFTLLNYTVQFDENGDPMFGSYAIVFWDQSSDIQEVGYYNFNGFNFSINSTKIKWHTTTGQVPTSVCSKECDVGYKKTQDGIHECCFNCTICPNGTYINSTGDPYKCINCKDTEWSEEGSTSCNPRAVEYIPFTDIWAVGIMVCALALVFISLASSVLFALNYNTPVVKSAGGPMCFLILGCLSLSSLSVFFYFGKPTVAFCILRYSPFLLFFTVCLACFVVRSFQIVCIFKIAAQIPKLHSWWMKYHGQWLFIAVAFVTQAIFILINFTYATPRSKKDMYWDPQKIILDCEIDFKAASVSLVLPLSLCSLCFVFSYMGKDLPKNYNEAKAITFCLLLLILTWIIFATGRILYHGKYIQPLQALAVLSSLYSFLLWYFFPKCYIVIFQPQKNTQQYFQSLIQSYTKTISQ